MATPHHGQDTLRLYTAEEAAEILRVKKSWLERQAAARKIPFTMLGRSYRFTSAHLAAIVRMHEQAPAPSGWTRRQRHPLPTPQRRTTRNSRRIGAAAAPAAQRPA